MMQFTPKGVSINTIVSEVNTIDGIKNIHHIHIWQINEHVIMLEAHLELEDDIRISKFEKILKQTKSVLENHNINHITLQPEFSSDCGQGIIGQGDC